MFEIGRLCMKIAGREAGKYCVVVKKIDENFVMVTGPRDLTSVKRRRCNVNHLEPMMDLLKIKSDAPDSDVLKAYQEENLIRKLNLEPAKKAHKEAGHKPAAKPAEKKTEKPEHKESRPAKKESKPAGKKPAPKKAKPKKPAAKAKNAQKSARKTKK
jgi:large subunit ribosomal protein L14e